MSAEHTPGPWRRHFTFNVIGEDGRLVASCAGHQSTVNPMVVEAENEANARLIAAAPELLEACQVAFELLSQMDAATDSLRFHDEIVQLGVAIAKAEAR